MNCSLIFCLSFLLGLSVSAYSQVFAPLGAKWTHVQPNNYNHAGACKYSDKIKSFEVYEERIIDGAIYNVLRLDSVDLLTYREDNQRVYYYENDSAYLLMDFSLTVGDTLIIKMPFYANKLRLSDCCGTPVDEVVYNVAYKDTLVTIESRVLKQLHFRSFYLIENPSDGTMRESSLGRFIYTERIGSYSAPLEFPKGVCCTAEYCRDIFLCY